MACRMQFTDNKPFRLLEQFLLQNICLTFWGQFNSVILGLYFVLRQEMQGVKAFIISTLKGF